MPDIQNLPLLLHKENLKQLRLSDGKENILCTNATECRCFPKSSLHIFCIQPLRCPNHFLLHLFHTGKDTENWFRRGTEPSPKCSCRKLGKPFCPHHFECGLYDFFFRKFTFRWHLPFSLRFGNIPILKFLLRNICFATSVSYYTETFTSCQGPFIKNYPVLL